jgi:trk system potassium uptake protein
VVGCGRLGGILASRVSRAGYNVLVIDEDENSFDRHLLREYSGFRLVGDAVELSVLQKANIQDADYLFAVTAQDNVNLMVAQVAKIIFNIPHVVARVYDPARESLYRNFNIETVSPIQMSADILWTRCFGTDGEA